MKREAEVKERRPTRNGDENIGEKWEWRLASANGQFTPLISREPRRKNKEMVRVFTVGATATNLRFSNKRIFLSTFPSKFLITNLSKSNMKIFWSCNHIMQPYHGLISHS